ncbi:hypothetical protein C8R44DRAFT_818231, partial [Mycena epipterygia]
PWTRFRHHTMTDDPTTPSHQRIPPFRPRQRAPGPPLPRFNPHAAKFHAISSRLPPLTSRAACARYRLSRRLAAPPDTYAAIEHMHRRLGDLRTHLIHLLDIVPETIPADAILTHAASDIRFLHRASSSRCVLEPPNQSYHIFDHPSSFSTPLQDHLKPAPSPCAVSLHKGIRVWWTDQHGRYKSDASVPLPLHL